MKKNIIIILFLSFMAFACDYQRPKETYVGKGKVVESTNCQVNQGVLKSQTYTTCHSKVEFKGKFYVAKLSSFVSRNQEKDIGLNAPVDMCSLESGLVRVCANYKAQ